MLVPTRRARRALLGTLTAVAAALAACAHPTPSHDTPKAVATPWQHFGHNFGDDYWLANYTQLVEYWQRVAKQTNRMRLVQIGTTGEGRPMWMAILSAPENLQRLEYYRSISARLANADGLTDREARQLAADGKVIVWIDGGLHSNEVLSFTQLGQLVYELASQTDAETSRFLRDAIILAVPANPDGIELVANWYMRRTDSTARTISGLPRLYNRYIGHDNNRDSYMASQPETRAMDSILFRAWYPQIMYNHHQTGPAGTVMASAPYRDPFNYNIDPLIPAELDLVGAAMSTRFIQENKPGVTIRDGSEFSTWWNGGLRTTVYFHNMVGILTETIGGPTPFTIPVVPERLLPSGALMSPVLPQTWHFARSVAYSMSANRAVLDVATRQREQFLYNMYRMGKNAIDRGSRDEWTLTPRRVAAVRRAVESAKAAKRTLTAAQAVAALHDPAARDARGYILPSNQRDFLTATKFVNALMTTGVTVLRATDRFTVAGRSYPAGSYVIKTAQAFRPHVLDMFEPQDYPHDSAANGTQTPPYDNAGWTLAFQMGVQFDRVLDGFDGPFVRVANVATVAAPAVPSPLVGQWYHWSGAQNDAFLALNRLLKAGLRVVRDSNGDFFTPATAATQTILATTSRSTGIAVSLVAALRDSSTVRPVRIALWDVYGGSLTSGWTRFLFDQFEFPYDLVYAPQLDAGQLQTKYDVIFLPDGAIVGQTGGRRPGSPPPADVPSEWTSHIGAMTVERTLPALKEFLHDGGTIIANGSAAWIAAQLDLPIAGGLSDSTGIPLERNQFYVPGSILSARLDTNSALTRGMPDRVDVMFDDSPVFTLLPGAKEAGITRVAWYDSSAPLRSGWALGQRYLYEGAAVVRAPIGKGTLLLYGPEMNFRSQSHGTFKLLFNGIYPPSSLR